MSYIQRRKIAASDKLPMARRDESSTATISGAVHDNEMAHLFTRFEQSAGWIWADTVADVRKALVRQIAV